MGLFNNGKKKTEESVNNELYTIDGKYLYFGTYPQSRVTDSTLIDELNSLASNLPTEAKSKGWIDYGYYVNATVYTYMWYKDVKHDGNKYRAVYFTTCRPPKTWHYDQSDKLYQNENGYNIINVYWFKYEPIKWQIVKEEKGKLMIVTDLLIDSQDYNSRYSLDSKRLQNGRWGDENNYRLSCIRKWLNHNFLDAAFSGEQGSIILTTKVDNSSASTGMEFNKCSCRSTNDKIFLLSYVEAMTFYESKEKIKATGTDYAKCQGLLVNSDSYSYWWLRSPSEFHSITLSVWYDGIISGMYTYNTSIGVRPACWISVE